MPATQTARLITPQGKTIFLPSKIYKAVLQVIEKWKATQPAASVAQEELSALIEETRGKYAGGPSLVDALLAERERERLHVALSQTGVGALIKEMQVKYAKYPSFNEALLAERARERGREERRLRA